MTVEEDNKAFADLVQKVRDNYPDLATFFERPGIATILLQGAKDSITPDVMEQRLHGTEYWRTTTDAQRKWDLLSGTDPAEATRQYWSNTQSTRRIGESLGVQLDDATYQKIATERTRNGWDDKMVTTALLGAHADGGWKPVSGGDLGHTITGIRGATANYGVTISDPQIYKYAQGILNGSQTAEGVDEYLRSAAISRYSRNDALVAALKNGMTTKSFADPYMQVAAKELAINPEAIDMQDSKWSRFLEESPDPAKQGMTLDHWRQTIRSDQVYGWDNTQGAKDEAATLASQLTKKFGATG